jgi:hypothetical protein
MGRILTAGLIATGLLLPGSAIANEGDFARGSGSNQFALGTLGEASFALVATSDPFGARPAGYVTSRGDPDGVGPMEQFTARGRVTCLRVEGNRASIKWRFDHATGSAAPFEGGGVQSFLEDNGRPRAGRSVDRALIDPPQPPGSFGLNAGECDDPSTRATYDRLESGDVRVHDATGR